MQVQVAHALVIGAPGDAAQASKSRPRAFRCWLISHTSRRSAEPTQSGDTQPDNVMLVADSAVPGGVRTKLLDFGIAKMRGERDSPSAQTQTKTGALMGTPVYMSPEQCRGAGGVAERTDVYSLGIMLYQMLAGAPPFQAPGTGELMAQHMYSEPPSLQERAPQVSDEAALLIAAMLIKDPEIRPSMQEVEIELVRLSGAQIGSAVTGGHAMSRHSGNPIGQIVLGGSLVDPFLSTMGGALNGNGQPPLMGPTPVMRPGLSLGVAQTTGPHAALKTGPHAALSTGPTPSLHTGPHTPVVVGAHAGLKTLPPGRPWWHLVLSGTAVVALVMGGVLALTQRSGARAEQLLEQARSDLRAQRWAAAEGHATDVLAIESLEPGQREGALELKVRAEREHRAQTVYEAMRTAEQSGRGEESLRLYQQLPQDSTLAAAAQEIFARVAPRVLSAATAHIEAAQREGRCEESRREAEQLAQLLPTQPEAQLLAARPCQAQASSEQALQMQTAARTLLNKWIDAHLQGRAPALHALYAERVLGVHRQGERVALADRAQWLNERTALLQQPVVLSVTGTRIVATAGAARIFFNYVWESAGPQQERETGRAEMFLLREPAGLRIAREELWPERPLAKTGPTPRTRNPDQFAFVEGMDLVLPTEVEDRWTQGALVIEPGADPVRVSRSVDPAQLPADVVRWQGRRVQLYDLTGKRCEARVVGFKVVGRLRPHLELQRQWQSADPQTVAREAWELTSGGRVLVAGLEGERADCQGARWARAIELPDPKLEAVRDASPELRRAALEELRKLPAYAEIAAALAAGSAVSQPSGRRTRGKAGAAKAAPEPPPRASWDAAAEARVEVSILTSHGATLVSVSAQAGPGCVGLSHQMWAMWQLQGDPNRPDWQLISAPRSGQGGTPRAVLDLDGDGTPELLFVPAGMGELLGVARGRRPAGADRGTTGAAGSGGNTEAGDGVIYDDFELNRLPVLDSSC